MLTVVFSLVAGSWPLLLASWSVRCFIVLRRANEGETTPAFYVAFSPWICATLPVIYFFPKVWPADCPKEFLQGVGLG